MVKYISYAQYERQLAAELRRLGLPVTIVNYNSDHHLKPKKTRKSLPLNGRRGHRASMPRHGGSNKRTGN